MTGPVQQPLSILKIFIVRIIIQVFTAILWQTRIKIICNIVIQNTLIL